jgi:hypothetical protein
VNIKINFQIFSISNFNYIPQILVLTSFLIFESLVTITFIIFIYTGVVTSNNGPNNVRTQPNKHIPQRSRYQLIFLFFNESKTDFIKTISSCRYVTSIKPKMYLCLNKNNLKKLH